ncbi:GNAT family N-acetyltransferase [Kiloniella sp. EL199]|uniref:GNAT family N-acetyltransferase n=1 Tax=Kiloniella sp. EL199 TaxID=2107581 RepID=UPI000EA17390|nr:GNAT family N-acetyltransferase [Kiloniella sp. EL199]
MGSSSKTENTPLGGSAPKLSEVDVLRVSFETERLRLRRFTSDDYQALYEMRSREEVMRYLYGEPYTDEVTQVELERRVGIKSFDQDGDQIVLAVEEKQTGDFVGDLVLFLVDKASCQGEIGFVFNPHHHGKGYGYEAARVLVEFGFKHIGLHRIIGRCDPRNKASSGLLRKLGMKQEAHLIDNVWAKGEWTSELIFAMRNSEWPETRP